MLSLLPPPVCRRPFLKPATSPGPGARPTPGRCPARPARAAPRAPPAATARPRCRGSPGAGCSPGSPHPPPAPARWWRPLQGRPWAASAAAGTQRRLGNSAGAPGRASSGKWQLQHKLAGRGSDTHRPAGGPGTGPARSRGARWGCTNRRKMQTFEARLPANCRQPPKHPNQPASNRQSGLQQRQQRHL